MLPGAVGRQGGDQGQGAQDRRSRTALETRHKGPKEELCTDKGRGGIPGQAQERPSVGKDAEEGGLARAYRHALDLHG